MSADSKARIVFLRWNNPLPGHEAFTRYARNDPRIDFEYLKTHYGPLPSDPLEQNKLWYKLYKSVKAEPSVTQVHRNYLFTRDFTFISLIMLIILGPVGFYQIPSIRLASIFTAALIGQHLLANNAAKKHGQRFVSTVLAIKGAGG